MKDTSILLTTKNDKCIDQVLNFLEIVKYANICLNRIQKRYTRLSAIRNKSYKKLSLKIAKILRKFFKKLGKYFFVAKEIYAK